MTLPTQWGPPEATQWDSLTWLDFSQYFQVTGNQHFPQTIKHFKLSAGTPQDRTPKEEWVCGIVQGKGVKVVNQEPVTSWRKIREPIHARDHPRTITGVWSPPQNMTTCSSVTEGYLNQLRSLDKDHEMQLKSSESLISGPFEFRFCSPCIVLYMFLQTGRTHWEVAHTWETPPGKRKSRRKGRRKTDLQQPNQAQSILQSLKRCRRRRRRQRKGEAWPGAQQAPIS